MTRTRQNQILRVIASLEISEYLDYRKFLEDLFMGLKSRIKRFNHCEFSEVLGFSSSNNSIRLVISGKRNLSTNAAVKISDNLKLKGARRRYWLKMVEFNRASNPEKREKLFKDLMNERNKISPKKLDEQQKAYFSEWYIPVIREMFTQNGRGIEPEDIQKQLHFPIRLEQIKHALKLLVQIGALHYDKKVKKYSKPDKPFETEWEVDSLAIVRYHQKMLDASKDSITRVKEDLRAINALTVNLPKASFETVKSRIQDLLDEVLEMEEENKDSDSEVYQLNVQLFPFTKNSGEK